MNAFLSALQSKSEEVKKTVVKPTPKPELVKPEVVGYTLPADVIRETPTLTVSPSPVFDMSGEAFEAYRKEVDRLCEHYKCDKADLAVIAVMHLGRLIAAH